MEKVAQQISWVRCTRRGQIDFLSLVSLDLAEQVAFLRAALKA